MITYNYHGVALHGGLLEALAIFLGASPLAPFDHPRHLKSEYPLGRSATEACLLEASKCSHLRKIWPQF